MLKLRLILLVGVIGIPLTLMGQEEAADPPEVALGERLFLETRFSQFFKAFLDTGGGINNPLPTGDPVVDQTATTHAPLPGPFRGTSINCRSCHLVDEHVETPGGGMRTYADFARRSPVPDRTDDPAHTATRNAPALVNASATRVTPGCCCTSTASSPAWRIWSGKLSPEEFRLAAGREAPGDRDDGPRHPGGRRSGCARCGLRRASVFGGARGYLAQIPKELRLPGNSGSTSTVPPIARSSTPWPDFVAAYTEQLEFSRDERGAFNLSPFDVFLARNHLPRRPEPRESDVEYSRRLVRLVTALDAAGQLRFVTANPNTDDGTFSFHDQPFRFTREELDGMRIFFREPLDRSRQTRSRPRYSAIASPVTPRPTSPISACTTRA